MIDALVQTSTAKDGREAILVTVRESGSPDMVGGGGSGGQAERERPLATIAELAAENETLRSANNALKARIGELIAINAAERETLATRELLLGEMNHRIKNLFAVMASLVLGSARDAGSVQELASDLSTRVEALARAHALCQKSPDDPPTLLGDLARMTVAPLLTSRQARFTGPDLAVPAEMVTPLALILHEWAVNAAKHGAFSTPDGRLSLSWDAKEDLSWLVWTEEGKTGAAPRAAAGFGTRLIEATVKQLGARLDTRSEEGRLAYRLEIRGLAPTA